MRSPKTCDVGGFGPLFRKRKAPGGGESVEDATISHDSVAVEAATLQVFPLSAAYRPPGGGITIIVTCAGDPYVGEQDDAWYMYTRGKHGSARGKVPLAVGYAGNNGPSHITCLHHHHFITGYHH
jgi:hypothetical protein